MTNPPIGLVLAAMDEGSERAGTGSLFETPGERLLPKAEMFFRPGAVAIGAWWEHANRNDPIWQALHSRGGGGPSGTTPASTIPSKASNGRASAQAMKSGGPRQSSQRGGRARGKCPKGHYWSYKKKKCVKSKFR